MADPEMNADRVKEPIVPRKSRVKHREYEIPDYEPKSTYKKSLYGFGKGTKSIDESLAEVREEKAAAKKAYNDRLKKEWMVEAPKCHLQVISGKKSAKTLSRLHLVAEMPRFTQLLIILPFKKPKNEKWKT